LFAAEALALGAEVRGKVLNAPQALAELEAATGLSLR
jgi:hypothetical protein